MTWRDRVNAELARVFGGVKSRGLTFVADEAAEFERLVVRYDPSTGLPCFAHEDDEPTKVFRRPKLPAVNPELVKWLKEGL